MNGVQVMAGLAPEGSQFDGRKNDAKMELCQVDGQEFFTSYDEIHNSFDAMGLQENLLRGIYVYGFEKPSAIQQRGIIPFCKGLDVIQQAQSGTGKTATFCSGILQRLDYGVVQCQALVFAPTRELAQQIETVMSALGDYLGVKVHACVGGTSVCEDQRILSAGVHVVVGTPWRVFDISMRRYLRADYIKMFVIDEADELMLSRGFKDPIYGIFQLLPAKVQVGVFSPTMPPEVLEITRKFMNKPVRIQVKRDKFYVTVDKEWKLETLRDLYEILSITQNAIVFNIRRLIYKMCEFTTSGNGISRSSTFLNFLKAKWSNNHSESQHAADATVVEELKYIPMELWNVIISKCNILDRAKLSMVSKFFRDACRCFHFQELNKFDEIKWKMWILPISTPIVEVIDAISWEITRMRYEVEPDAVKLEQHFTAVRFLKSFIDDYGSHFSSDPRYWKLENAREFLLGKFP